jgi:DNA-binding MarR family transcriptional regulator
MDKQDCNSAAARQPNTLPEIFQLIEMVEKKLKRIQRETVGKVDLTPPQYFILTLLWEKDGRPFKELASAAHCSRATMTGIVDTLEKKDLVTRAPNPGDRRSLLVKLTEKGDALEQTAPTLEGVFSTCCTSLEPDEIRQLGALLRKLDHSLTF